jgi:2-polyprenyl-3-methyl-5-hydroxy-6-metoxy-1,4-benzoquinol methylase
VTFVVSRSDQRTLVDASCTICRSDGRSPTYTVDGYHVVRCKGCGHLYVSPRPSMDEIHSIYDEHYFANPAFGSTDHDAYFGYMDYLLDRERIQVRLSEVLSRIERHEWRGRLLDIGCGLGFFVETAAQHGWDAWGVDLNRSAVAWAQEHVHPQVGHGTVADLGFDDGAFDCVTMFDVVEHLADPRAELEEVWRVLRPGGLLVLVTPDAGALVSRLLGPHWLEMKRAPEHLQFFSVEGLARMLGLSGFTAFEWHSIGKITTLRTVLADLKFYSPELFGWVERRLEHHGLTDKVVDIDPRPKLCLYARKTHEAQALDAGAFHPGEVTKVRRRRSLPRRILRAPLVHRRQKAARRRAEPVRLSDVPGWSDRQGADGSGWFGGTFEN